MYKEEMDEILEEMFKTLKGIKNGSEISFYELSNGCDYDSDMVKVLDRLFKESRKHNVLLDASEYFGQIVGVIQFIPFTVWNKKRYMSDEDFQNLCDEYDHLFDGIDPDARGSVKKIRERRTQWKKDRSVFRRNPALPPKEKKKKEREKCPYIEDLDHTPFNEPVPEALEKKGITIIPIGSGSSGNCFYIEIGGYKLLIDMGIGVKKVKAALEVNLRHIEDIDAIFLTHGHSDHVCARKAITNNTSCKVYGEEGSFDWMKDLKSEFVKLNCYEKHEVLPGLFVKCFVVNHDYIFTVGYTFRCGNAKIGYLTDNGVMEKNIYDELKGSDVIIIESNHDYRMLDENKEYTEDLKRRIRSNQGHLSNVQCGEAMVKLHEAGTRNFLLAHLSQHNNTPELALETVKLIMRERWADIYVCPEEGHDLLEY